MSTRIDFERYICEAMTSYRIIGALAILLNPNVNDSLKMLTWLDLIKHMKERMNVTLPDQQETVENMLRDFIEDNRDWIIYTLCDMCWFAKNTIGLDFDSKSIDDMRLEHYLPRMLDQKMFLEWNATAFKIPDSENHILVDVGCGTFPYFGLFVKNNSTLQKYVGIDKRTVELPITVSEKVSVSYISRDVLTLQNWRLPGAPDYDILFLGETLHCLPMPVQWLKNIMQHNGTLRHIMVLQPHVDIQRGLSQLFSFHMKIHANGAFLNSKTMSYLAMLLKMRLTSRQASSQHTMWIYSK